MAGKKESTPVNRMVQPGTVRVRALKNLNEADTHRAAALGALVEAVKP